MDLEARTTIELELGKGSSFKAIGLLLGKDCTTISKEVRTHLVFEKTGAYGRAFNDCQNALFRNCDSRHVCDQCTTPKRPCWFCGKCMETCISYIKYSCPKLAKAPYVCNGCKERSYRASYAQKEYDTVKSDPVPALLFPKQN